MRVFTELCMNVNDLELELEIGEVNMELNVPKLKVLQLHRTFWKSQFQSMSKYEGSISMT